MAGTVYPLGFDLSNLGKGLLQNAFSPDFSKKYAYTQTTNTTDSRDLSRSLQYNPTYVINSPNSSTNPNPILSTKKEATVLQTSTPTTAQSGFTPTEKTTPSKTNLGQDIMGNLTGVLIIGAVLGGGYLYLNKGKGVKKKK